MLRQRVNPIADRLQHYAGGLPYKMEDEYTDEMIYPPGYQEGQQWDDENPYLQDESMMGVPEQPMEEPQMAGGYGAIGSRMERMRPTLVHSREDLKRRFPKGLPPDVEETTAAMEGAGSDRLRYAELHDRQHRQLKGHARTSKFGLRRSLSDLKATKRAEDRAAISGPSADSQYDEVEMLRRELQDLKRSMGAR